MVIDFSSVLLATAICIMAVCLISLIGGIPRLLTYNNRASEPSWRDPNVPLTSSRVPVAPPMSPSAPVTAQQPRKRKSDLKRRRRKSRKRNRKRRR